MPFSKIVVPLDGSPWTERAIPHGEQIARGGGELILLYIYKPAGSEFLSDAVLADQTSHIAQARENAEQYVKGLRGTIASPNIKVRIQLMEGNDPARMVCDFVNSEEADVVVMPASSHSKLVSVLLGDLTTKVSGCVNACLLLVRGDLEAEFDEASQKVLAERDAEAVMSGFDAAPEGELPANTELLEQLTTLHKAGILSASEFKAKKAKLEKMA